MLNILHNRNNRYGRSFLCFVAVCILAVCIVNERPQFDYYSSADSDNVGTLSSSGSGYCEVVSDEITGGSVIRGIISKKPGPGRAVGSGALLTYAMVSSLFVISVAGVFFFRHFFRDLASSHLFIITYIHNLDGMKP